MKKLFLLLLIALPMLVSCGDDDEKNEPVYLDNALLEGKWYRIDRTDSIVLLFKDDYMVWITYDKYSHYEEIRSFYGEYKITETMIITKNMKHLYVLDKDTLFIKGLNNKEFWKHIRLKN